jgi:hypothetical protein
LGDWENEGIKEFENLKMDVKATYVPMSYSFKYIGYALWFFVPL